jgi:hypothetical protein
LSKNEERIMSTAIAEMNTTAAAPVTIRGAQAPVTAPAEPLRLVSAAQSTPPLAEITFLDDHPLVPVFVIGAISMVLAVTAVASVVFWLAIRYSGVLAP